MLFLKTIVQPARHFSFCCYHFASPLIFYSIFFVFSCCHYTYAFEFESEKAGHGPEAVKWDPTKPALDHLRFRVERYCANLDSYITTIDPTFAYGYRGTFQGTSDYNKLGLFGSRINPKKKMLRWLVKAYGYLNMAEKCCVHREGSEFKFFLSLLEWSARVLATTKEYYMVKGHRYMTQMVAKEVSKNNEKKGFFLSLQNVIRQHYPSIPTDKPTSDSFLEAQVKSSLINSIFDKVGTDFIFRAVMKKVFEDKKAEEKVKELTNIQFKKELYKNAIQEREYETKNVEGKIHEKVSEEQTKIKEEIVKKMKEEGEEIKEEIEDEDEEDGEEDEEDDDEDNEESDQKVKEIENIATEVKVPESLIKLDKPQVKTTKSRKRKSESALAALVAASTTRPEISKTLLVTTSIVLGSGVISICVLGYKLMIKRKHLLARIRKRQQNDQNKRVQ